MSWVEQLSQEDKDNLVEVFERFYRETRKVFESPTGANRVLATAVPDRDAYLVTGQRITALRDAVNAIALLVGEELV